jgi:hypothetical protein
MSILALLAWLFFYKTAVGLSSYPANLSFSRSSQGWVNMVNLRALTPFTFLSQVAFIGANAHSNSSELLNIVPKREVL